MSGQEGGFPRAAARFSSAVDQALTTARRAAREARAQSVEFRRRTEELASQAKSGKLRGLRRDEVVATTEEARADAVKFRTDNGLPVPELPTAAELMASLPKHDLAPVVPENEDFSAHQVMVDVDGPRAPEEFDGDHGADESETSEAPADTRPSDAEEDFSQQRILMDATVESYRPGQSEDGPDSSPDAWNPR